MISIQDAELFKRLPHLNSYLHSKNLDKKFGYKIPKIEAKLLQKYKAYDNYSNEINRKNHYDDSQTWIGLHPNALQTPYNDIFETLEILKKQKISNVVDIGCAYGRVGIVSNHIFPDAKFTGFEIVKNRANEANRIFEKFGLENCNVVTANILDDEFILPEADIYFIYDFSEIDDIKKVLLLILNKMKSKKFFLVVRGDRVNTVFKNQINLRKFQTDTLLDIYTVRPN